MRTLIHLALKSAWQRKTSVLLALASIAVSIFLLLAVDHVRREAKNSFTNTISQTDLIIGARGGAMNLLLYSVFRLGSATNNFSYSSFEALQNHPDIDWAVPISLGDSHRGYRVVGTSTAFFDRYRYANKRPLRFADGTSFSDLYDVVIGEQVARQLGYQLGDRLVLTHGLANTQLAAHDNKPFQVSGILAPTGTPVDHALHVSLEAIEALHVDWRAGTKLPINISADQARKMALQPEAITAALLGMKSKVKTYQMQRWINQYPDEPLMAILPGATLAQLWQMLGNFERLLLVVASLVLLAGLIGMLTTLLTTLNERRREIAILRTVGARATHVFGLFVFEALLIVGGGALLGLGLFYLAQFTAQPLIEARYGLYLPITAPHPVQWGVIGLAILLGIIASVLPGWMAYRRSLQDGLTVKL